MTNASRRWLALEVPLIVGMLGFPYFEYTAGGIVLDLSNNSGSFLSWRSHEKTSRHSPLLIYKSPGKAML